MDQNNNKININNKEYDTRDLSESANRLIRCIVIAEREIDQESAQVFIKEQGRQAIIQQLIAEVEKEDTPND